jgi:hypothetical protein
VSSIPEVYEALLDLLTTALPDVQVTMPGTTTLGPSVLLIGKVVGVRSAGSQNRIRTTTRNIPFGTSQDEYTVEMFISVSRPGTDLIAPIAAADVIFEAARDAIEASDDLDISGVYEALPTSDFEFEPEADANGRYVTVRFGVDITARD